jgi:hypothetical protein
VGVGSGSEKFIGGGCKTYFGIGFGNGLYIILFCIILKYKDIGPLRLCIVIYMTKMIMSQSQILLSQVSISTLSFSKLFLTRTRKTQIYILRMHTFPMYYEECIRWYRGTGHIFCPWSCVVTEATDKHKVNMAGMTRSGITNVLFVTTQNHEKVKLWLNTSFYRKVYKLISVYWGHSTQKKLGPLGTPGAAFTKCFYNSSTLLLRLFYNYSLRSFSSFSAENPSQPQ